MAQAVVEYNYDAALPDELTIRKGDLISDVVPNSPGWWEGTLTRDGKRGLFPDNFVKLVNDPNGLALSRHSSSGRKCKVLFSYKPMNEDELELHVDDIIDIISEVEEGWWKGKLNNRIGVFPSNFVEEISNNGTREASQRQQKISVSETVKTTMGGEQEQTTSNSHTMIASTTSERDATPSVPSLPPKPVKELCKVIFNYEPANPDELALREGDVITLITKEGQDPGWWKGEHKGRIGLFPDNFVQIITTAEETSPISKPERPTKALTSSKSKDSISKDSISKMMTSSMSNIASISRKYSDNVRPDEKTTHPLLTKKPVLPPPPLKKPQRSSSDLAKSPTAPNLLSSAKHQPDISPSSLSATAKSPTNQPTVVASVRTSVNDSENVTVNSALATSKRTILEKSSDNLDGALWSKSASYTVTETSYSSSSSSTINNMSSTMIMSASGDSELDLVERSAMLTHPTASRVKAPKRRPPSTIYTGGDASNVEESPETTTSSLSTSASSTTVTTMLNGDADSHALPEKQPASKKVPWVEELKLNQAKKSMQAGNKTRVMIGGSETTSSSIQSVTTSVSSTNIASPTATSPEQVKATPTITGVTLRSHQSPSSSSSVPTPRPQSMISSLRSSLVSPQSGDAGITITAEQWNDLLGKVARLEMQFEKTVEELTAKLNEEKAHRQQLQQEIDKITNLVTQV
ncbi:Variant SH3 domain [Nesidiocoris tenuis]|uniref:Variant SH3 domain n=1 Tax=Nesidiocoris tenuis TaxID=355587 RepID=A0ABN7A9I1_9HEMI|nr:Variant SH3 domain [Nesidiocoris tenuis]